MNFIYNTTLRLIELILTLIARLSATFPNGGKFRKFAEGQLKLIENIETEIHNTTNHLPTLWIHASSLGEYGVARPIIKQLRQQGKYRIIITFFSSTGYEALKWHHPDADHVFYLPLDTRRNVHRFLDIVQPQKAIFIISEYWVNYLSELKRRNIPTYLISAVITSNAPFFKWYGGIYRKSLKTFTHFMVLNKQSEANLRSLGFSNITVTGDPLFDNAIAVAATPWSNSIIKNFARQGDLFIAGSISDKKDMELISTLANNHRDTHFIIVPHEISEEVLNEIKFNLDGYALCYSECNESTDFSDTQALIIDYLGDLAYLYRYGKWAYVGGGFTPYLHSIIEATVYGLPVAFGPLIHRKVTPNELIELNIGSVIRSSRELEGWFATLKKNQTGLETIRKTAQEYTRQNSGATSHIVQLLLQV